MFFNRNFRKIKKAIKELDKDIKKLEETITENSSKNHYYLEMLEELSKKLKEEQRLKEEALYLNMVYDKFIQRINKAKDGKEIEKILADLRVRLISLNNKQIHTYFSQL